MPKSLNLWNPLYRYYTYKFVHIDFEYRVQQLSAYGNTILHIHGIILENWNFNCRLVGNLSEWFIQADNHAFKIMYLLFFCYPCTNYGFQICFLKRAIMFKERTILCTYIKMGFGESVQMEEIKKNNTTNTSGFSCAF